MLITGSRKGIGRHLVEHYLSQGWIVEGCSREASDLSHPRYTHHAADVSDERAAQRVLKSVEQRHRRLDALICNAGIASMNHVLLTPGKTLEQILQTNVLGSFVFIRESARLMQRRKFGRIVTMGSVAVPLRLEGEAAYAASKAAVLSLTQVLARELAPFGITCNLVGPSPIETDMIRSVPRDKMQRLIDALAIKRLGRFEDVTNVVDFFVRKESDYVTGQAIYLGGV